MLNTVHKRNCIFYILICFYRCSCNECNMQASSPSREHVPVYHCANVWHPVDCRSALQSLALCRWCCEALAAAVSNTSTQYRQQTSQFFIIIIIIIVAKIRVTLSQNKLICHKMLVRWMGMRPSQDGDDNLLPLIVNTLADNLSIIVSFKIV